MFQLKGEPLINSVDVWLVSKPLYQLVNWDNMWLQYQSSHKYNGTCKQAVDKS